jgi:hypothetical protein
MSLGGEQRFGRAGPESQPMPLKICRDQQILFVQETTGYSIALHGAGTDVKGLLTNCLS